MARASRGRHTGGRFGVQRLGSSGDGAAPPLFEALIDAQRVIGIREQSLPGIDQNEPRAFQKVNEQKRGRDELRDSDRTGIEKSA